MDMQRVYWMIDSVSLLYNKAAELHELEMETTQSTEGKAESWQEVVRLMFATLQVLKDIRDEELEDKE